MIITLYTPECVSIWMLPSGQAYFNHLYRITESSGWKTPSKSSNQWKINEKTIVSQVDDVKIGMEGLLHSSKMLGERDFEHKKCYIQDSRAVIKK